MIALITAAGWKPFNEAKSKDPDIVPHRTPEALWPLGDGHCVLSRLAHQFYQAGGELVMAGIGVPGCSPLYAEHTQGQKFYFKLDGHGEPVWTMKTLKYTMSAGVCPVLIQDPHDNGRNCWTTLLDMLPMVPETDKLIVCAGDYVFDTGFLHKLIDKAVWSSQVQLWPKHSIEFLNPEGREAFVDFLETFDYPGQGTVYLAREDLEPTIEIVDMPAPPRTDMGARRAAFQELSKNWIECGTHYRRTLQFVRAHPL
jgi:hypothetical protein